MSKAFTREDDAADLPPLRKPVALLPPGTRNLVTPEGKERLWVELTSLRAERPVLVEGSLTDVELRPELAQLDQRITYLEQSLATAEVVLPAPPADDRVRFGSTVTFRDQRGIESTYRIVGVDEADYERHEISWLSPLAAALLNTRSGQILPFRSPDGADRLEVVKIQHGRGVEADGSSSG